MEPSSTSSAVARLGAFGSLDRHELAGLRDMVGQPRSLSRGTTLWCAGDPLPGLYLLLDGWMASSMKVAGDRDRVFKVHLPGDVLGLPSLAFSSATETVAALTSVSVQTLPLQSIGQIFETQPRIAALLFLVSQQERVDLIDRITSMSATSALTKTAAVLLQLCRRVELSFPDWGGSFFMPVDQRQLADLSGVPVMMNQRNIRQLSEQGVLSWIRNTLTIYDLDALTELAQIPDRTVNQDADWLPINR